MATFLTADLHCGDPRFEIMGRPFKSSDEMISTLISNHNFMVSPSDEVIIVGDLCYQKTPGFLKYIEFFNGKKTLIRGNHDRTLLDSDLKRYFHTIIPEGDGLELDIEGIPCYCTHYPTRGRSDRFNITAHVHRAWTYQLNMFNCGIDANHFYPVDAKKIPFHFKTILDVYDDDIWCAYNSINQKYQGVRGKSGSYFKEQIINDIGEKS